MKKIKNTILLVQFFSDTLTNYEPKIFLRLVLYSRKYSLIKRTKNHGEAFSRNNFDIMIMNNDTNDNAQLLSKNIGRDGLLEENIPPF